MMSWVMKTTCYTGQYCAPIYGDPPKVTLFLYISKLAALSFKWKLTITRLSSSLAISPSTLPSPTQLYFPVASWVFHHDS